MRTLLDFSTSYRKLFNAKFDHPLTTPTKWTQNLLRRCLSQKKKWRLEFQFIRQRHILSYVLWSLFWIWLKHFSFPSSTYLRFYIYQKLVKLLLLYRLSWAFVRGWQEAMPPSAEISPLPRRKLILIIFAFSYFVFLLQK